MKELIGVEHVSQKGADAVLNYINNKYPDNISIMLELPPKDLEKNIETHSEFHYFRYLEQQLTQKENRTIIYGDRLYPEAKWVFLRYSMFDNISEFKAENMILTQRNKDMSKLLQEKNIDIVVLGALHTTYLKKEYTNIHHSFFSEGYIFRSDPKDKDFSKEKKAILSTVDELFMVKFTLYGLSDFMTRYPNLKKVSRL